MEYRIYNRSRQRRNNILKVSTFEVNGKIKTVWVDRIKNYRIYKNFENVPKNSPLYKSVKNFMRNNPCRTIDYYSGGVYKYTCRYYGISEINIHKQRSF